MADINTSASAAKKHAGYRKTLSAKIDLTAMVDLAFLLITFFMLTTTLAKQNQMEVAIPVDAPPTGADEQRTMTICLGRSDRLEWFMGSIENPLTKPAVCGYSSDGIRKALVSSARTAQRLTGKHLIVLIKPSAKSKYKNLVDILDELEIAKVKTYAISDLGPAEAESMAVKKVL